MLFGLLNAGGEGEVLSFGGGGLVGEVRVAKGVLCIDPSCGAEGDHLPQDVKEIVPGGGEDVPEGCSWVGLKLDVVRKLGQTWPVFLCRCSE